MQSSNHYSYSRLPPKIQYFLELIPLLLISLVRCACQKSTYFLTLLMTNQQYWIEQQRCFSLHTLPFIKLEPSHLHFLQIKLCYTAFQVASKLSCQQHQIKFQMAIPDLIKAFDMTLTSVRKLETYRSWRNCILNQTFAIVECYIKGCISQLFYTVINQFQQSLDY